MRRPLSWPFSSLSVRPRTCQRLALLLIGLCLTAAAPAQDCAQALPEAEQRYVTGGFDETIALLEACLDTGALERDERQRAYRLIGLSYIGKDLQDEARAAIERLLQLVPDYRPDPVDDPPPFVRIVEELRQAAPARAPIVTGVWEPVVLRLDGRPAERDLADLFRDPDGDALTYAAQLRVPGVAAADLDGDRLTLRPLGLGQTTLVLTALDASGLTADHEVEIRVAPAPTEPIARPSRRGRRIGRWLLIGGGLVAGGVAAAVLAGGGGGSAAPGPIGGPPPLPSLR